MRYFLFICVTFITLSATSQDCKYRINEVDDFTEKQIIETKERALDKSGWGLTGGVSVAARSVDESKYLVFSFFENSIFSVEEGSRLLLKSKDEVLELNFSDYQIADFVGGAMWVLKAYIPISPNQYKDLIGFEVEKLRFYTTDGYIEKEIKSRRADRISKLLQCL